MCTYKPQHKFGPWTIENCHHHTTWYPIENVQERFLPMFYYGKGVGWRRQFIGVLGLNFFHGPSVNMILGRIPLIENFSMTSQQLSLGYSAVSGCVLDSWWWFAFDSWYRLAFSFSVSHKIMKCISFEFMFHAGDKPTTTLVWFHFGRFWPLM